jgi:hypothetical protein
MLSDEDEPPGKEEDDPAPAPEPDIVLARKRGAVKLAGLDGRERDHVDEVLARQQPDSRTALACVRRGDA